MKISLVRYRNNSLEISIWDTEDQQLACLSAYIEPFFLDHSGGKHPIQAAAGHLERLGFHSVLHAGDRELEFIREQLRRQRSQKRVRKVVTLFTHFVPKNYWSLKFGIQLLLL